MNGLFRSSELAAWRATESHSALVSDLGEATLTQVILGLVPKDSLNAVGNGDDAAVLAAMTGKPVISVDVTVEDRHFKREWSTPSQVGQRAIAQGLADVEAMGGRSSSVLVGLGLPTDTPVRVIEDLYEGISRECIEQGVAVVGGDLVLTDKLMLSITAVGELHHPPLSLAKAQPGDAIIIAGELGWSAAGYDLLQDPRIQEEIPDFATSPKSVTVISKALNRFRIPEVPYGMGSHAASVGVRCMTDVSDGLLQELHTIAVRSRVRCELESDLISNDLDLAHLARLLGRKGSADWVLYGGEDHALVGTCSPEAIPSGFLCIGTVYSGEPAVVIDSEVVHPLAWDSIRGSFQE